MSAPSAQDISSITAAIDSLHASSRRTVPMFLIGLAATLLAAAVAIYYIVQLSSDLAAARAELAMTQDKLDEARKSLTVGHAVLQSLDAQITGAQGLQDSEARQIKGAIFDIDRSRGELAHAYEGVRAATSRITPDAAPPPPSPTADTSPPGWYAVTASYPQTPQGLERALADVARIAREGLCTEVWETQISKHYAVILGPKTTRELAQDAVALAQAKGIAADAFLQVDRDWKRIREGGKCESAREARNLG